MAECKEMAVPIDVCYVRFSERSKGRGRTIDAGHTHRGEQVIVDIDPTGHVVGIELIGGKACQQMEIGFTACWKEVYGKPGHCRMPKGHEGDCAPS